MLILEDYLEIIENLPQEFRDRFTLLREYDLQVHNDMDKLEEKLNKFFSIAHTLPKDARDAQYSQFKQECQKVVDISDEKVALANQMNEIIVKYSKRLQHDLNKFKMELEADNAGITEMLEKRSLELDSCASLEKRRSSTITNLSNNDLKLNTLSDKTTNLIQDPFISGQNVSLNKHSKNNTQPISQLTSFEKSKFNIFNPKLISDKSKLSLHLSGQDAIAAAASQAIAATQQLHHGRPTPSLKASIDAINSNNGLSSLYNFNRLDDLDSAGFLRNGLDDYKNKKARLNKRNRMSSLYNMLDLSNNNSDATSSDTFNTELSNDPNEPRYCICRNISYGEMIQCEQVGCPYEWFHYECVGIKKVPEGQWFCTECKSKQKKRKEF